jgi:heptose I phosphotransferase
MPTIEIEHWDDGRLRINAAFAGWLRALGLTSVAAFDRRSDGEVYRRVGERITSRLELPHPDGVRAVYLKRHGRLPFRERLKAWGRLQTPVWGARPEWDAILEFHRLGLPTMTPIACGEADGRSFLLTDALENCERLDHWLARHKAPSLADGALRRQLTRSVADVARRLHDSGWHHQDLYLCHWLWPAGASTERLHLIDLGRVRRHAGWSARRWIVKDLAQLHYSAHDATPGECWRFLRSYLGRPLCSRDKSLVRSILRKSAQIARHSQKNGL